MPIQQLMLGVGAKKKTYVDDIFSNYLWAGNGSDRTITNGINLKGEGGMVWVKQRNSAQDHIIGDTARDDPSLTGQKFLSSNDNGAETSDTNGIKYFYNTGFSTGSGGHVNSSGNDYSSWTFRKAPGFFDVVTYTGNPTSGGRQIAHSLGCVPGMIMIKCTSESKDWIVYHRELGNGKALELNTTDPEATSSTYWSDTDPTSTHFTLGTSITVNGDSKDYVAYLFAGGESTAATAKSCPFDGNNDALTLAASNDFDFGTGDFTLEFWMKPDTTDSNAPMSLGSSASAGGFQMYISDFKMKWYYHDGSNNDYRLISPVLTQGAWQHIALVRSSNTITLYYNGTAADTYNASGKSVGHNSNNFVRIGCGGEASAGSFWDGAVSNLRIVKGTAVYTSSFKPPTEPLTNITNTKLLCCNNSSATTATVTPGTITGNGGLSQGSDDSPFDDPAAYVFGESGSESVIKCGSYTGNGSSTGPEINLGFEPQWILIKNASASQGWRQFDSMRGIPTGGSDARLFPNNSDAESDAADYIDLTSTGFKLKDNGSDLNGDGNTIIYMCVRRPDGYVGKPAEAGTDVFAMDVGNSSTGIPNFDSGFPVDYALLKQFNASANWHSLSRLTGDKYVNANQTASQQSYSNFKWDSNEGWYDGNVHNSAYQSWMWKRHAGFDVVTYKGNGESGRALPHSLSKSPEMMWVKNRDSGSENWMVYHKDLATATGGTDSETDYLVLNSDGGYADHSGIWSDTAPTATHFTVGNHSTVNNNGHDVIAMLFSSVSGISKVGSYSGSSSAVTLDLGFQPRFIIIKRYNSGGKGWYVFDTTRGINAGNDPYLELDEDAAQVNTQDWVDLTSTGITINSGMSGGHAVNDNGDKYIYYAHA